MTSTNPAHPTDPTSAAIGRRTLIGAGAAAAIGLGAAGTTYALRDRPDPIGPTSPLVSAAEKDRPSTGTVVSASLVAQRTQIDLGGRVVDTRAFGDAVHGPLIRATSGDELKIRLRNDMDTSTTVHWHGLALRNDMDGVPGVTQRSVKASAEFEYAFTAPDPGTYWYHPHVGTQLDTGLYGPLIIDDPADPGDFDVEAILMLDDWTDGWGPRPAAILQDMQDNGMGGMGGMGGMNMSTSKDEPLGDDTGDVSYPGHLINGRLPTDAITVEAKPGQRVKIRVINAGGDTAYRFAIQDHSLTVTHSDGYATAPVETDALIIGMGERYDVEITAKDGTFAIAAVPEGKDDPAASAVLRTSRSSTSAVDPRSVPELKKRLLTYADLAPAESVRLSMRKVDTTLDLSLDMGRHGREWRLNGKTYEDREPLEISQGDRVRIRMKNRTMMFHPMHLHGHTFALAGNGTRKDTVNVLPMRSQSIDFDAVNPGQWLMHCHNVYHGEMGMMTVVSYVS